MLYYGFNFLWMFSHNPWSPTPLKLDLRQLDFVAEEGFNFVRIPTDYTFWTKDFDYTHPDERMLENIDRYIEACRHRGLHACLNLHRAPGYCVNNPKAEKHNLWLDAEAQEGFIFLWRYFAEKYKDIPSSQLSFDLVNEPMNHRDHPCTRQTHESVIRKTISAIREIDPSRRIVIDGFDGGSSALPELSDVGAVHSGRGYEPFMFTHYKAEWTDMGEYPEPKWPMDFGNGRIFNIEYLRRHYQPWRDVEAKGVEVHIGELGCYNKLPNPTALAWLRDLMQVYKENRWGYSLWNFDGPFGIIGHNRPDTKWEEYKGFTVDKEMLNILKSGMITD